MHTRTTTAALILLATALTACTSSSTSDPTPERTATTSAAPTTERATLIQRCVDAVALIPPSADGSVPSEPVPNECDNLSDSEYLDAYMDGIAQANEAAVDAW